MQHTSVLSYFFCQPRKKERREAASPSEAVTAVLAQKMVSSKINAVAIRKLMDIREVRFIWWLSFWRKY
jgi:hypothetical protein